jgi:hypothetical protein
MMRCRSPSAAHRPRLAPSRRRPRWTRFQGIGRLYITVAEARRFLASATVTRAEARSG